MATITLQGNEINTNGEIPSVGSDAPDFFLVNSEMKDISLSDYKGKKKLLSIVPSLDTPVCATSTIKFNKSAKNNPNVVFLIISADLPSMWWRSRKWTSLPSLNKAIEGEEGG